MEEKRRKRGENVHGNFTFRLNTYDYDQIKRLKELTRLPTRKAIMFAVNQYLGTYEVNSNEKVFWSLLFYKLC